MKTVSDTMVASRIISRLHLSHGLGNFLGCNKILAILLFPWPSPFGREAETLVSRSTPNPELVFRASRICIQSISASFPKPPHPHKRPPRSLEDALLVPTRCACRLALTITREAGLDEKSAWQGTAGGGQIKAASNMLGRLAKLGAVWSQYPSRLYRRWAPPAVIVANLVSWIPLQPFDGEYDTARIARESWSRRRIVVLGHGFAVNDFEGHQVQAKVMPDFRRPHHP